MRVLTTLLSILCLLPASANAGETDVYESMRDVSIGRVFLSPAERRDLDVRRANPDTGPPTGSSPSDIEKAEPETEPAGYIVRGNSEPRYWRDGNFVETGRPAPRTLEFPGDVTVVRHTPRTAETVQQPTRDEDAVDEQGDDGDAAE